MNNTQELRWTRCGGGFRRRKALIDLNQAPRDQEGGTSASETAPPIQASQPVHAMIDVDAIEDDVVESSASDFAEAISKSSGARRRRSRDGVESGGMTRLSPSKRRRVPPNQPFTEEMSTKCGHIFCKGCIQMAISKQGKCPTCRKKVTVKELIRVFLPTTR
ncbi:RING/U-box superfamily protein [Raphanus sativus]|nr:RING/U-box superfamily protein [Raphanus sativus]